MLRWACLAFASLAIGLTAGGCDDGDIGGSGGGGLAPSGGSGTGAGAGPVAPSGYLLIPEARMAELRAAVDAGSPRWQALKANVDEEMGELNGYNCGPENVALVYLLTGEEKYARSALEWARLTMESVDVSGGSYLDYGSAMREVAIVLNYCGEALSGVERTELADYLDRWTNELWFDNQGSGWGLEDPGNNYHYAFLEGTAYAGYALREVGHPNAQTYLDVLVDHVEKEGGVLDYLSSRAKGGDWQEGANYGERSKQRMCSAFSAIASMGGPNYWGSAFFPESLRFAVYQLLPGGKALYPSGDLARDVKMPASPYERDHIQTAAFWLDDAEAVGLAQWYLEEVTPTYDEPGFRGLIFKDMLFGRDDAPVAPETLPRSYRSPGTEWVHYRSAWDSGAVALGVSGTPLIDQSHAHIDVGSFTLWKNGWLAVDAVTYSHDGLNWDAGAHNMITVQGHERRNGATPGLRSFLADDAAGYAWASVDGSLLFKQEDEVMLEEWTRELVFVNPGTLVVYDRVDPGGKGADYEWRIHFPDEPAQGDGVWTLSRDGAGIAVQPLLGGTATVRDDGDLEDGSSEAHRLALGPTSDVSRYLVVVAVGDGGPPTIGAELVEGDDIEGAAWADQAVVFSKASKGAPLALPFSYTVPGTGPRTHTVTGAPPGAVDVAVDKTGADTVITVTAGSQHTVTAEGALHFADDG